MDSVRGTLHKIMSETIRRMPPQEAVATAWGFVCGNAVAERTQVLDFADGVLKIEVPDTTWRTQLSGMAGQYISGLTAYTGQKLDNIEFLLPRQAERWRATKTNPPSAPSK